MFKRECVFCEILSESRGRIVDQNSHAFLVADGFPVAVGHSLAIPKRHVENYFDLNETELICINALLKSRKLQIESGSREPVGFNVGVNYGAIAGQTVSHCHVHLIPRRSGDVEYPTGGVRNVIPGKGEYGL